MVLKQGASDEPDIFQQLVDAANAARFELILIGGHAVRARACARLASSLISSSARDLPAWRSAQLWAAAAQRAHKSG